jgi:hypothetical protein
VRKNRNAQFGLLRDQVELRILREENAKFREEKKKGVIGKLGKGVGMVTSILQRGASDVAHAAGDLTDRSGDLMAKVMNVARKQAPTHSRLTLLSFSQYQS